MRYSHFMYNPYPIPRAASQTAPLLRAPLWGCFFLPMSLSYFRASTTTTISHMRKWHNHLQNNCQNAVWSGFRNLSVGENKSKSHKWVDKSQLHQIQSRRMVNNLKKWMSQTLKESGVSHLQTVDRGLQTNHTSQLLKANRSKMGPET